MRRTAGQPLPAQSRRYVPDLGRHLSQCEWNYHRLLKLLPAQTQNECSYVIVSGKQNIQVKLHITERSKYTTTLQLLTPDTSGESALWPAGPSMVVRLYHDASLAEVLSCQQQTHFAPVYDYPNPAMRQRDEKAQLNRFLGDWLTHCLAFGHATEPMLSSGPAC
ncbi:MAG TPA: DUF1249 domain-containing protein [Pseudomonadales bacterium]|nr:DUF1249 domain-containing protein [Pseudomonadales bacterium]